ncbi:trihelix transcription factor GTL1-like isoform X2 [Curcuma longa]|uniref:trihelix transcription factor GTL1-like isoform X2 n=1 Tax=Curcuma longa TaxID=136217 RepID=UPI003D9E08B3
MKLKLIHGDCSNPHSIGHLSLSLFLSLALSLSLSFSFSPPTQRKGRGGRRNRRGEFINPAPFVGRRDRRGRRAATMQQKSGEGLQFQAEMAGARPPGLVDPAQPPPPAAAAAESPSPISSRPPPPPPAAPPGVVNFDELGSAVAGAVGFLDDEEAERGGPSGSRWPKQETLALLKIRSEMDAAFRDATFKGPLWEEISRKLAELGYKRSAKKCKEKFENVHKYYKRTKEGRAGRQDGKTYRFFTQLEALHGRSGGGDAATATAIAAPPITAEPPATFSFTTPLMSAPPPAATRIQPFPFSAAAPPLVATPTRLVPEIGQQRLSSSAGISFSSNSSFSSSSDSDSEEEMAEAGGNAEERKRKRGSIGRPARRQMRAFFEGLMRQVMERQEAMQQRFLEAIEKREHERMKREEAWLLQEMARLSREQELLVQERAMAASRDAAVISYLQKITGQPITLPTMPSAPTLPLVTSVVPLTSLPSHNPPPAPPPPSNPPQPPPSLQKHEAAQRPTPITIQTSPASQLTPISSEPQEGRGPGSGGFDAPSSSSRWPKAEVHALIKLRSELESRYQEAGPKGPLWEEISASMQRLGYNRNSKRCKEKWENINKYFKKVKESNKKRQEDSKTCPYFDQLDALYRRKQIGSAAGSSRSLAAQQQQEHLDTNPTKEHSPLQLHSPAPQDHGKNEKTNDGNSDTGGAVQIPTSNGGHTPSFIEEGMKKKTL